MFIKDWFDAKNHETKAVIDNAKPIHINTPERNVLATGIVSFPAT